MAVEFFIHKMSEHMETAQILHWLVKEGEQVEQFQVIMEVMTDKVTAEIESPEAGIITGIRPGAIDGATVPVGEPICYIAAAGETTPALPPLAGYEATDERRKTKDEGRTTDAAAMPKGIDAEPVAGPRASPVARKIAEALGIDLASVTGTGPLGHITEADVRTFAAKTTDEGPTTKDEGAPVDHASQITQHAILPTQYVPLTPIQRITGERMRESVVTAPQFALDVDVDMTAALWLRDEIAERVSAKTGSKPSITALLVKVVAAGLRQHPRANTEFADGRLKLHEAINIGVAVGADDGLVVPVIRDADRKSISEISRSLRAFQEQATTLHFSVDDLADGTFTISNLGMFGVDRFRAIVNPPQSAILAAGRIIKTPVGMPDDTIALRPTLSLTLTVDHRCMDGIQAARFLAEVRGLLERPHLLLA